MSLPARNGWFDEQGRVYIYYTVDEILEDMNCGNNKAIKLLSELDTKKGVGLIERVKQGQGKPTRIYVKRFTTGAVPPNRNPDLDFSDFQTLEKLMPRDREIRGADIGKPDANHNNQNQTEKSYTDPSIYPLAPADARWRDGMDKAEKFVREQIDYDGPQVQYPFEDIDSFLELILEVLGSMAPTIGIGGELVPAEAVKRRFKRLDRTHIEYVLDSLKKTTSTKYETSGPICSRRFTMRL